MYVEGGGGEEVGVGEVVKLASFPHSVLYSTLGEKFSVLPPQGQRRTNAVSPADGRLGSQEIRVLFLPPPYAFCLLGRTFVYEAGEGGKSLDDDEDKKET